MLSEMGKPKNIVKSSTNCVSMSKMLIMKINNFGRYSSKRKSEAKINLSCVNKPCIVSYLSAEKLNRKYNKVSKEKKKLAVKLKEANLANERLKSSNRSLLKSEKSLLQDKVNLEEELAKAKKRVVRSKKEEDCVKSSSCLIVGKQRVTKADVKWVYSELNKCEKLLEQSTLEVNSLKEELVKPVVNVVHQFVAKLQKNMCTQTEDIKNGQNMNEFALKLSPKILSNKLDSNGLECSAMEVDSKFTEEKRQPIKELSKDFEDWLLRINIQELQNGKLAPRQVVESYLQYAPFNFLEEFLV